MSSPNFQKDARRAEEADSTAKQDERSLAAAAQDAVDRTDNRRVMERGACMEAMEWEGAVGRATAQASGADAARNSASAITAARIRSFLHRSGITEASDQTFWIARNLDVRRPHAESLLNGREPWTDELLYRLSSALHVTIGDFFDDYPGDWVMAFVKVGSAYFPAMTLLVTGDTTCTDDSLVVINNGSSRLVVSYREATDIVIVGVVKKICILPERGIRLAILDDDAVLGRTLQQSLEGPELTATVFTHEEPLFEDPRKFDAYIIDWWLGGTKTAQEVIARIRADHGPDPLIFILTGEDADTLRKSADFQAAVMVHAAVFRQKPVSTRALRSEIMTSKRRRINAVLIPSGES